MRNGRGKSHIHTNPPLSSLLTHRLYWAQQEGTDFHLLLFRLILLLNGLYVAMMLVLFYPSDHFGNKYPWNNAPDGMNALASWEYVIFVVLSAIPIFFQMKERRRLVTTLSHVSCIGCLRRPQIIANVIRDDKTSRAVRAFIVLHKIHLATQNITAEKGGVEKQNQEYLENNRMHFRRRWRATSSTTSAKRSIFSTRTGGGRSARRSWRI